MLLEHRAVRIDPDGKTLLIRSPEGDETNLPYDKLILDTGAVSIKPNLPGIYTPPLSSPWDPVQMAAQAWVTAWRKATAQ